MPQYRSLKTLLIESVIFIGLFALVGHMSVNFWERYMIKSELSQMKCSLHTMKETITFIEKAYDYLYNEIKGLSDLTEIKRSPAISVKQMETNNFNTLNKRKLHDLQFQAMIKDMHDVKVGKNYMNYTNFDKIDKMTGLDNNATTITKYPLKSMGTSSKTLDVSDHDCKYNNYGTTHSRY